MRLFWRLGQESRIRVNPITNMFGKLKKKNLKVLKFDSALTLFKQTEPSGIPRFGTLGC